MKTTDRRSFLQASLSGLAGVVSVPLLGGGLAGCQQLPSRQSAGSTTGQTTGGTTARKTALTTEKLADRLTRRSTGTPARGSAAPAAASKVTSRPARSRSSTCCSTPERTSTPASPTAILAQPNSSPTFRAATTRARPHSSPQPNWGGIGSSSKCSIAAQTRPCATPPAKPHSTTRAHRRRPGPERQREAAGQRRLQAALRPWRFSKRYRLSPGPSLGQSPASVETSSTAQAKAALNSRKTPCREFQ